MLSERFQNYADGTRLFLAHLSARSTGGQDDIDLDTFLGLGPTSASAGELLHGDAPSGRTILSGAARSTAVLALHGRRHTSTTADGTDICDGGRTAAAARLIARREARRRMCGCVPHAMRAAMAARAGQTTRARSTKR